MLTETLYVNIITRVQNLVNIYKDFTLKEELSKDIDNKVFKNLIEAMYKLCIYMILHDPILTLNIEEYTKRELNYYFHSKSDYINIEGFGKNDPSLVILNPPMLKNKFPYQGIKPAVYIITEPDEKIKEICVKNQIIIDFNKQSKSSKNSFDVSADNAGKILTANSNKDNIVIQEQEQVKDYNEFNKKTKETTVLIEKINSNSNYKEEMTKFIEKNNSQILSPDFNQNSKLEAKKDYTNIITKIDVVLKKDRTSNDDNKLKNTNKIMRPLNNSPTILKTTFSNDILSVSSILDVENDENDFKITENNKEHIICFDQPLKKEELWGRSSSLKKMNKYTIEHRKNQQSGKIINKLNINNNMNSARTNDEMNIHYQTTMNNEKAENVGNSFVLKNNQKKNEKKINSICSPKNERINHKRMKSSHTGSFSSHNYVLSEDNTSSNNLHNFIKNKHTSLSKKSKFIFL